MTLYFWMHWFWITSWLYLIYGDSQPTLTTYPTEHPLAANITNTTANSTSTERKSKAIGVANLNPPSSMLTPSSSEPVSPIPVNTTTVILSKPSIKTMDFFHSNTTVDTTRLYPKKEVSVINENISDTSVNAVDNQTLLVNSSAINHADNLTYVGIGEEVAYNQSLILNPERISEAEAEANGNLTAASITGITLGCVLFVGLICGGSYILYRNRGFNRPQVLNDRCSNPDSSGYIDDASVRDNSEEMYSLDNDSFLNSLEAMTIQNYWTDTVKHTKL